MPNSVCVLVNGDIDSAMGVRARAFARELADDFQFHIVYRRGGKISAAWRMLRELARLKPRAVYVLDMAASGVMAAIAWRMVGGARWIVDTGDAIVELGKSLGRGTVAMAATRALEWLALWLSSAVVVRGTRHQELLARRGIRAAFIPDGVDVGQFAPPVNQQPKGPADPLVIGIVGSTVWSPLRDACYGWELLDIVAGLRQRLARPVRGIVVGDGDGLARLKARCGELGLDEVVEFTGWVPYDQLPALILRMDVCLSPQTNDVVGRVRTTGKLPLYMAAGRFILASRVGEAALVLPEEMLVDGPDIEAWLQKAIEGTVSETAIRHHHQLARFDYKLLARDFKKIIETHA